MPAGYPTLAAAEAVVNLLGLADGEGRSLFTVERTQPHMVLAAPLERHMRRHHIHQVGGGPYPLDLVVRNAHRRLERAPLPYFI